MKPAKPRNKRPQAPPALAAPPEEQTFAEVVEMIQAARGLDAINKASAREKSIRHGHPSTLHLWWARRPVAAARAVIFSQMVADPSAYVDVLRADPKLRRKAEAVLKARLKLWQEARTLAEKAQEAGLPVPEPGPASTLEALSYNGLVQSLPEITRSPAEQDGLFADTGERSDS